MTLAGLEVWYYETYLPRSFLLDDGTRVTLRAADVESPGGSPFLLYVPPNRVEAVREALLRQGFREAEPTKGERHSLAKGLQAPWEMHIRLYGDGLVEAQVEVSREYGHLGDVRTLVVYEAFQLYHAAYDKLHVLYRPLNRWVVRVYDHFRISMRPPKVLTPWKPIVATLSTLAAVGPLVHVLSRLERP